MSKSFREKKSIGFIILMKRQKHKIFLTISLGLFQVIEYLIYDFVQSIILIAFIKFKLSILKIFWKLVKSLKKSSKLVVLNSSFCIVIYVK